MPLKFTDGKTLVFVTKMYPYGKYEPYITEELKYLSKDFSSILIYPNEYYGEDGPHGRDLPGNAQVINLNTALKGYSKFHPADYFVLFATLVRELFATDDLKSNRNNFRSNLIHLWTQIRLSNIVKDFLKKSGLNDHNTVFYSYWFGKSAMLLSVLKLKGIVRRFSARAHSVELYHDGWGLLNEKTKVPAFKMFKLRMVDHLFTVSNHGERYLRSKYDMDQRLSTRYLGVSGPATHIPRERSGPFLIVTCSRLEAIKRVDRLVNALKTITDPVRWVHFGGGGDEERITSLVKELPGNIRAELMGTRPNTEIMEWYSRNGGELFVNLSVVEGLPVSIMEALAYGMPVLATSIFGTPEAVIDGENGFLIDLNFTDEELISRLTYCISHREEMKQMGERSYALWKKRFNAAANYTSISEFLSQQ